MYLRLWTLKEQISLQSKSAFNCEEDTGCFWAMWVQLATLAMSAMTNGSDVVGWLICKPRLLSFHFLYPLPAWPVVAGSPQDSHWLLYINLSLHGEELFAKPSHYKKKQHNFRFHLQNHSCYDPSSKRISPESKGKKLEKTILRVSELMTQFHCFETATECWPESLSCSWDTRRPSSKAYS